MTKPKTLTLSAKKSTGSATTSASLAVPKTSLSYVIDNAQEEAGKVTVVKKSRRLAAVPPVAEPAEAVADEAVVKTRARKTAAAKPVSLAVVAEEAPAAAPAKRGRKPKAAEPAPVIVTSGPAAVTEVRDAAVLASIDTSGYLLPQVKVPGRRGRKPSEFTPENDEVAALNAVERAELKAASKARERLQWSAGHLMESGLAETIQWYERFLESGAAASALGIPAAMAGPPAK